MIRSTSRKLILAFVCLVPCVACADGLPASFSLGKFIPGDWWMYIHSAQNPERAWIEEEWNEVWDALAKSGIDKDALGLVMSIVEDDHRQEADEALNKLRDLLAGVRWGDLIQREMVIAERVMPPVPDWAMLARGAEGSGAHNAKGLANILAFLDSLIEEIELVQEKRGDIDVWTLKLAADAKYSVNLFCKGDLIGIVTSQTALTEILQLMQGTSSRPSIVDTPRFKEALAAVKAPEDHLTYFDFKMLMTGLNGVINKAFEGADKEAAEETAAIKKAVGSLLTLADFIDYQVTTTETDGNREYTRGLCKLQADRANSPIARAIYQRKPFDRFDKFVPADATSFRLDASVDIPLLYATAIDFVEQNIPGGKEGIKEFKNELASLGFDPERDVFSWWGGELVTVEMPAAVVTPLGGSDTVLMIRVKDPKLAAEKVDAGLNWVKGMVDKAGKDFPMPLLLNPAVGGPEGFREIMIPPIAMFCRPVVGVSGEFLVFGTSVAGVNKCADVASGKSPSVVQNERFKAEGIIPKGPVAGASFADTSHLAQEMGAVLTALSFAGRMGVAQIPSDGCDEDAKKAKQAMGKVFDVLMKLGPVINKIDFYSSESSVTTVNGLESRTEKVVTYKPHQGTAKSAKADGK